MSIIYKVSTTSKYPCGIGTGHICLGPWTNPDGLKGCLNGKAVNYARPKGANGKGLRDDAIKTKAKTAFAKIFPEYKKIRAGGGTIVWSSACRLLDEKGL